MAKAKGPDPPREVEEIDLSPRAIKRAVIRATGDNPATIAPLGAAVAAGVWCLTFGPAVPALAVLGVGAVMGAASILLNGFLWSGDHAARYLSRMDAALVDRRRRKVEELQVALIECGERVKDVDELVTQATSQCEQILERINRVRGVLAEKLSPTELAYSRYSGTTEQVSLAVLDNLQAVVHLLISLPNDVAETDQQLKRLERKQRRADEEIRYQALLGRKRIHGEQIEKIAKILGQNETAITDLDSAAATIAAAKTLRGEAEMTLEESRRYLEELVERTRKRSVETMDPLKEKTR